MRVCQKIRYRSKRAAKRARRDIGDAGLRPYRCLSAACERSWHLGHLAASVTRGETSRTDYYGPPR